MVESNLKPENRSQAVTLLKEYYHISDLAELTDPQLHELYLIHKKKENQYANTVHSIAKKKFKEIPKVNPSEEYITVGKMRVTLKNQECETCTQNVRMYKTKIHSKMAQALILMYKEEEQFQDRFTHMPTLCQNNNLRYQDVSLAKAAYWGLIEAAKNDDPKKKDSGLWKLTTLGRNFVKKEIEIDKFVYVYDSKVYRQVMNETHREKVEITDSLGDDFNYTDMMNNYPNG